METVRPLDAGGAAGAGLFFERNDTAVGGTLEGPLAFGMGFSSLEPPRPTSLAGFGGGGRRALPPNPSGMDGFFTYCLPYKSVDLAPRAKVLLWQGRARGGATRALALVSLDIVASPADVSRKIVSALAARWPKLGLDHASVQVVASHTHSGPAGLTENPFWSVFACDRYSRRLWDHFEARVVEAFAAALKDAAPLADTGATRRSAALPGFNKSRFEGMAVDDRLLSFRFPRARESAVGPSGRGAPCVQIFAAHPTWFGAGDLVLSSDVVGHAERELTEVNLGTPCVFLNGAVGNADIKHDAGLDDWAQRFAELAVAGDALGPWKPVGQEIEFGARVIELPDTKINLKACKVPPIDALVSARILANLPPRTKVAYARLGGTMFLFFPGEAVATVSRALEKAVLAVRKDVDVVQVLSVSNDYLGYVVDSDNFNARTLESCSTLYGRRISDALRGAFMSLVARSPAGPPETAAETSRGWP